MKVKFTKNEAAVWATEREWRAHWNPEVGLAPGATFRLTDSGKWVRAGGGPGQPGALPDVVAAWHAYLATLIVGEP